MTNRIQISIPKPCHENWDAMTPSDRGRFCIACQKQVIDFTKASDREIATALQQDKNLCGRFVSTQLERELIIHKEKSRIASILALAFSLVTLTVNAQEKKKAPQVAHTKYTVKKQKKYKTPPITITGTVADSTNVPLGNVDVLIKGKSIQTKTDSLGAFKIKANIGDILVFDMIGYTAHQTKINAITPIKIILQENEGAMVMSYPVKRKVDIIGGGPVLIMSSKIEKERSFFGRIFHKIGNIFRKND